MRAAPFAYSRMRASVSSRGSAGSANSSVASTSTPAREAQIPISQSAAASASTSRAAYGAPEAPVIPRNTCIPRDCRWSLLVRALGGFEEQRELAQAVGTERGERRHRRALIDARRALQVVDLELDTQVSRADVGQVRRTEVLPSRAVVRVAGRTTRCREQLHPRLRVGGKVLVPDPARDVRLDLRRECLFRRRTLPRQHTH